MHEHSLSISQNANAEQCDINQSRVNRQPKNRPRRGPLFSDRQSKRTNKRVQTKASRQSTTLKNWPKQPDQRLMARINHPKKEKEKTDEFSRAAVFVELQQIFKIRKRKKSFDF